MNCGTEIGKWQETILVKKRKATGCIYLPGSDFREAEGHLSMRSCLQDSVCQFRSSHICDTRILQSRNVPNPSHVPDVCPPTVTQTNDAIFQHRPKLE